MTYDVVVVGAGFSGMCTAVKLKKAGIKNFVVLERNAEVGGAWYENTYPGCAVDIASMLYSLSFAPNPSWTKTFATQPELLAYAKAVADDFGLRPFIRLSTPLLGAVWDGGENVWVLDVGNGESLRARVVVGAFVGLNNPVIPDFPGREDFAGPSFHSARWDHSFDHAGKRVAVVGTGASAVQIVPEVAKTAAQVTVFQRSAAWVFPKLDLEIAPPVRQVFRRVPLVQRALRAALFGYQEVLHQAQAHPRVLPLLEQGVRARIRKQVKDQALAAKLTPTYAFSCKRPMISNVWYRTFNRPNVELVTDGINHVDATGIVDGTGRHHAFDAIVWSTGFHVQDAVAQYPDFVVGDGRSLKGLQAEHGNVAYRAIAVPHVPNLFLSVGPNGVLSHTSFLLTIESNTDAIVRLITLFRSKGIARFEVKPEAAEEFTTKAREELASAVWSVGGCTSYFITADKVNTITWPGSGFHQRRVMKELVLDDWLLTPAREPAPV